MRREIELHELNIVDTRSRLFSVLMGTAFCALCLYLMLPLGSLTRSFVEGIVAAAIISVFFQLVFKPDKKRIIGVGSLFGLILLLVIIFRKSIADGFVVYLNELIKRWNDKNGTIYYLFVTNNVRTRLDLLMFVLLVAIVLSLAINLLVYFRRSEYVVLTTFLLFILHSFIVEKMSVVVLLVASSLVVIYLAFDKIEVGVARKSKVFWVVLVTVVFVISGVSFYMCSLIPDDRLEGYRLNGIKSVEEMAYGKSDLPEGDLEKAESRDMSPSLRLRVEAEEQGLLYLKGYIGCNYRNNKWTELRKEAYSGDNAEMLHYMIENKETALTMLNSFLVLSNQFEEDTFKYDKETISVENIGASSKYIYVPYSIANTSFEYYDNVNKDQNVRNPLAGARDEYEFVSGAMDYNELVSLYDNGVLADVESSIKSSSIIENNDVRAPYFNMEQAYRNYVNAHYLEVSPSDASFFDSTLQSIETEEGVEYITKYIREYLKECTVYSDNIENSGKLGTWGNKAGRMNVLREFLSGEKPGYSIHYATAATLMYRYYGIPARYVEGYRCDVIAGTSNVGANSAHAWVEVYRYGMGWVPIDVTPGFYDEETDTPEVANVADSMGVSPVTPPDESQVEVLDSSPLKEKDSTGQDKRWDISYILLIIAILIVLAISIILIRLLILSIYIKTKIRSFSLEGILYMMGRVWYILGKMGIQVDEGLPIRSEDEIDREFQKSTGVGYKVIDDILMKARYSGKSLSSEEKIQLIKYYRRLKKAAVGRNRGFKRLLWKYIYVIY